MRNICFREGERPGLLGDSSSWGMEDERVVGSSSMCVCVGGGAQHGVEKFLETDFLTGVSP